MDKTVVTGKTDGFEMFDHDEISNWRLLCLPNQPGRQSCIAEIQRHFDLNAWRTVGDIGYGSTYRTKSLGLHPEREPLPDWRHLHLYVVRWWLWQAHQRHMPNHQFHNPVHEDSQFPAHMTVR